MFYHVREFGYNENYSELFKGMVELKAYLEKTYPGVTWTAMYNLDGVRGRVYIQSAYQSMREYEKISGQMDNDETVGAFYMKIMKSLDTNVPMEDHFYQGIS